jgi:uncharacterized small protein (DUF1192 family)
MNTKGKSAVEQAEALFDNPATKEVRPAVKVSSGYLELLAQRAALQEQIERARAEEVGAALERSYIHARTRTKASTRSS